MVTFSNPTSSTGGSIPQHTSSSSQTLHSQSAITMESMFAMLLRMDARLEASERRWEMAQAPPRPEPDPPYGMPSSWRLPECSPSGVSVSAPVMSSTTTPPQLAFSHATFTPPTTQQAALGFRPPPYAYQQPQEPLHNSWSRPNVEAAHTRSAWDQSIPRSTV